MDIHAQQLNPRGAWRGFWFPVRWQSGLSNYTLRRRIWYAHLNLHTLLNATVDYQRAAQALHKRTQSAHDRVGQQPATLCLTRSEEHTSELQSPDHLVCRLLLEKKKKNKRNSTDYRHR